MPEPDLVPSLLAASDVLGTGWLAAKTAEVGPGKTVAVIGDRAVGLLALEFGATDIVAERGDEGVAKIKELTGGLGVHSALEAAGTPESMRRSAPPAQVATSATSVSPTT